MSRGRGWSHPPATHRFAIGGARAGRGDPLDDALRDAARGGRIPAAEQLAGSA